MRTQMVAGILVAMTAIAAFAGAGDGEQQGGDGYRVDVIFDTAKGLLPGQLVKVAGARSGEIVDVRLTDDFKARVQLRVDPAFGPFRADARCTIQPEGLIGENFVQCDPGRSGPPLQARDSQAPTLPVERTSAPISLPELFNLATIPVRDRLRIVVGELGLGLAGRGEELNGLLRRAAPTLEVVQDLGRVLDRQRDKIGQAVLTTDEAVDELARRRSTVSDLIRRTGRVTARTASRRGDLARGVRGLPPLLSATRSTSERLDAVLRDSTPLLRDLRRSAPGLTRLLDATRPFARAATPALRDLGAVSVTARRAARRSRSTVRLLRKFAARALPVGIALEDALRDLRDHGVVENLLGGFYTVAVLNARYDKTSHMLPLRATIHSCSRLATEPQPGCDTRYTKQAARRERRRTPARGKSPMAARGPVARPPAATPSPAPSQRPAPTLPSIPPTGIDAVDDLLDGLGVLGGESRAPAPGGDADVTPLLDFLLG